MYIYLISLSNHPPLLIFYLYLCCACVSAKRASGATRWRRRLGLLLLLLLPPYPRILWSRASAAWRALPPLFCSTNAPSFSSPPPPLLHIPPRLPSLELSPRYLFLSCFMFIKLILIIVLPFWVQFTFWADLCSCFSIVTFNFLKWVLWNEKVTKVRGLSSFNLFCI